MKKVLTFVFHFGTSEKNITKNLSFHKDTNSTEILHVGTKFVVGGNCFKYGEVYDRIFDEKENTLTTRINDSSVYPENEIPLIQNLMEKNGWKQNNDPH